MPKPSEDSLTPKWLTIEDFEYLCFNSAKEFLSFKEPIPDYETRDDALLESALGSPRQTFGRKLLYPTLNKQAAILFYSLTKNHPFKNGNKRIAVMALLVFLALNTRWLSSSSSELYLLACNVSSSNPNEKDQQLESIEKFIEKYVD